MRIHSFDAPLLVGMSTFLVELKGHPQILGVTLKPSEDDSSQ
jgi:hypothetical protein